MDRKLEMVREKCVGRIDATNSRHNNEAHGDCLENLHMYEVQTGDVRSDLSGETMSAKYVTAVAPLSYGIDNGVPPFPFPPALPLPPLAFRSPPLNPVAARSHREDNDESR